jgi:hypothetical protein
VEKQPSPAWSFAWIYPVAFVLALAVFGFGIYLAANNRGWEILAAGCASVVAVLVTWPLALGMQSWRTGASSQLEQGLAPVNERLEQFSVMLNLISEQQLLSDRAKQIAFREKDRDALRRAIAEEIVKGDWEAAMQLASDIEGVFGSKQEADQFRAQINEKHNEAIRRQINDALAAIDRHVRSEQWHVAFTEAHQLAARFPSFEQVRNLPQDIEGRRQGHKRQLVQSWHDAVARKDIDGAIEILRKLDLYLTPAEATEFQETARQIFKEKINILRTQFSLAVKEENWSEAIRVGDTIVHDFPNSQMAREVRDMMDTLRQRAAELQQEAANV